MYYLVKSYKHKTVFHSDYSLLWSACLALRDCWQQPVEPDYVWLLLDANGWDKVDDLEYID